MAASVGVASAACLIGTSAIAAEPDAAHAAATPASPAAPAVSAPAAAPQLPALPPDATRIVVHGPAVIVVEPGDVAIDPGSVMPATPAPLPPPSLVREEPIAKPREVDHWFGWQTLLVDGASIAAGIAAGQTSQDGGTGAAVFLTGYVLGGPIVHWAHGQVGKGFASLGVRVGAPIVMGIGGALAGAVIGAGNNNYYDNNSSADGAAAGAALGILGGYVFAVVLDSAVLSREKVIETDEDREAARQDASATKRDVKMFNWTPSFGVPKGGGATAGISGTF